MIKLGWGSLPEKQLDIKEYSFLKLILDYSLKQYISIRVSSPSTPPRSSPSFLSSISTPLQFLWRKGQASEKLESDRTK